MQIKAWKILLFLQLSFSVYRPLNMTCCLLINEFVDYQSINQPIVWKLSNLFQFFSPITYIDALFACFYFAEEEPRLRILNP